MNVQIQTIKPEFIEHEGMWYLEFEGGFYKGCRRCGGTGHYSFDGESSICYGCGNSSEKLGEYISDNRADAEKWCHVRALAKANRDRKAAAKAQKARDDRDERIEALRTSDPEVLQTLQKVYDEENEAYATGDYKVIQRTNGFLRTMAGKLFNASESGLTENMIAAIRKTIAREAEKKANEVPAPSGRVLVTGEVVSAKTKEGDYGMQFKILVKDDRGFKVWVSIPKQQADEAYDEFVEKYPDPFVYGYSVWFEGSTTEPDKFKGVKGRRITFTANLAPSENDKSFAIGSRPTKGAWL